MKETGRDDEGSPEREPGEAGFGFVQRRGLDGMAHGGRNIAQTEGKVRFWYKGKVD
jgi:hypothetical protein